MASKSGSGTATSISSSVTPVYFAATIERNFGMTQLAQPNIWQKLTATHPSITDIEQRRQSRLLASFLLVLMTVFGIMALRGILVEHDMTGSPILLTNFGILGAWCFLNRRGR